ncbi:MAG: eukaryotic-like serine/threonine-protein kinase [Actinomycetota bacterium]
MAGEQATDRLVGDRYALRRIIGRGGVGQVWEATDTVLGRAAAVKEVALPDRLTETEREAVRARVMREARAAARLNHPRSVTVFDVVEEDGRLWLVMELVDGETLNERVQRLGPLSPVEAAAVGLQVLGALQHAHAEGVVHRDVKPSNVLVLPDGAVKLTDFGIASLTDDARITSTGMVLGSPSYMAPEQATAADAGPATDLWGLGAALYFAVEGVGPFDRGEPLPTMHAVVHEEARPSTRAGALAPVVTALLAKDPGARPSVAETRRLLEAVATERTAVAAPEPLPPAPEPLPPARRWLVPVALLAAVVLIGAVAALAGRSDDGNGGRSPATTAAPAAAQADVQTYVDEATGYRISYPEGWRVSRPGGNRVDFREPGSSTYLRVDWIKPPGSSPVGAWRSQSASFRSRYGDYREISIESTTYKGFDGARWEYTYSGQHASNLGFVTPEYGFALNFQTRAGDWDDAQDLRERLEEGFRPPTK